MIKLLTRILKRNHQLYEENRLYKRLNICLIRDNDNAFQRNLKAVEYIKKLYEDKNEGISIPDMYRFKDLMEILTTFKTENILDEVNGGKNESN